MLRYYLSLTLLFLSTLWPTNGTILPVIPPLSPLSPFYSQILAASNLSIPSTNITLNSKDYIKWFFSKASNGADFYPDVVILHVGQPFQVVKGIFDTGSHITWFRCDGGSTKPSQYPIFHQSASSSFRAITCGDDQWCKHQDWGIKPCYAPTDNCQFALQYADKTTVFGFMANDVTSVLNPPQPLTFGCSLDNVEGIVGASRSDYSLPFQLFPNNPKFSYCFSIDKTKTSFVKFGNSAILEGSVINMLTNDFTMHYYLDAFDITVNGESLANPSDLQMSEDGQKGIIIDSGTSVTQLNPTIFGVLYSWFLHEVGSPVPLFDLFDICYDSGKFGFWHPRPTIAIKFSPDILFEFEVPNMWGTIEGLECLLIQKWSSSLNILGAYQFLDVNVGYDPMANKLHLAKTTCYTE